MEPMPVDFEPKSSFSGCLASLAQLQGAVMIRASCLPKSLVPVHCFHFFFLSIH